MPAVFEHFCFVFTPLLKPESLEHSSDKKMERLISSLVRFFLLRHRSWGVNRKEKCSNTAGIPLNLCYYIFHYGKYQKFGNPGYKPPPYEASEDLGENEEIGKIWRFLVILSNFAHNF